jgi:uncharacterized protein
MPSHSFPPFEPHPLVRGAHAQTLVGAYLPTRHRRYQATRRTVALADGDHLVLHDDCPPRWRPGDRSALLIHGLGGCHESGYMRRIAHKLNDRGVRAFRMDLRGCGAGAALARLPYHSGRSEDAAAALGAIAEWLPESPTTLVGFSLGANITLKLLGELEGSACGNLDRAMAVCPPIDLAACSKRISQSVNRFYDRYFLRHLLTQLRTRCQLVPDAPAGAFSRRPRSLWEFDNQFTAVVCGFGTADAYYRAASSGPLIERIKTPTLVLASRDDPLVPFEALAQAKAPPDVTVVLTQSGGHLGFIGRGGVDADPRWMDWRVVDWASQPAPAVERRAAPASLATS